MANHSLNRASGCNSLAAKCLYIYCDESVEGALLCLTAGVAQRNLRRIESHTIYRRRRRRTMLCHFEAHIYGSTLSAGCATLWLASG